MRRTWVLAAATAAVLGSAAVWHYYPTPKTEAGEQPKSKGDPEKQVPGVPRELLHPRTAWPNPEAYDQAADKLAALFRENFEKTFWPSDDGPRESDPPL